MAFVSVPFVIDANQLADAAVLALQARWPGWEPADGDMEVIQIEVLAPMASDALVVAATVPDAIFREYGQSMYGLAYIEAQPAEGTAVITAVDDIGYFTDEPVEFALEGVAFQTTAGVEIEAGETSVAADIICLTPGVIGNSLMGSADQMSSVPWVDSIVVDPQTSGGADGETDSAYQDRLRERLSLQATTLVNGRDFEIMALTVPDVGRAVALVGEDRVVTVAVSDAEGEMLSAPTKTSIEELYADYRQVNTNYDVIDATYTTIDVAFAIETLDSFEESDVLARATDALTEWLSPANWGKPMGTNYDIESTWLQSTVVRINEAIRVVSVTGVRWVDSLTLDGGTADITLTGTVPLTRPGTITGSVV